MIGDGQGRQKGISMLVSRAHSPFPKWRKADLRERSSTEHSPQRSSLRLVISAAAAMVCIVGGFALLPTTVAHAAGPTALILGDSVSPGSAPDASGRSLEEYEANLDGFTTTVVTGTQWDAMTKSQFAAYQVLIIGDPTCDFTGNSFAAAVSNESTWEPVVMSSGGNKVLIGTDPTFHFLNNGVPGDKLEGGGIAFAGAVNGATGAYVDLSCGYDSTAAGTPIPLLDGLSTHGSGQFTAIGEGSINACATGVNIVANSGPTSGLTDSDLSNWNCSVHEAFDKFPSDYTPLAIAPASSGFPTSYCADDVETGGLACGSPYLMLSGGGVVVKSDVTLTPSTQTLITGGTASLVANVKVSGTPVSGGSVVFSVDSGPNAGKTFTGTTDASGNTTFTYTDTGGNGTDSVSATYTDSHGVSQKATATVIWGNTPPPGGCSSSPPTVKHVSPIGNPKMEIVRVLIQGTCLSGATHVTFGSVAATSFTVGYGGNITASPPQQLAGKVDVRVTTSGGGTSALNPPSDQYTYYLPTVTQVILNHGSVAGGNTVLIQGSMFSGTPTPKVSFGTGNFSSSVVVVSDGSIRALVPPHVSGTVDVLVTAFTGTSLPTSTDHYTYK